MSRRRPGRGVSLLAFLSADTTVRMYFCLFALTGAATTLGGVWRDQLPAADSYRGAAIAVGLMVLLGAGFYLLMPASRIRHRKLVHLGRVDGGRVSKRHQRRSLAYRPDIVAEVATLAAAAGVDLHSVWMSVDDPRGTALVFGRIGRRHLELKRGMVRRFDTDRASFDYVVNHELGHLHHRDVDLVYLPGSLFLGFLVLISLSFSFLPGLPDRASETGPAAQYFGFVVVTYLARNGVLREREFYADAFAVRRHHGGSDEAALTLARVLRHGPAAPPSLWSRLVSAHPSTTARVAALFDARQRPYAPLADAFMVGLLVTATLPLLLTPGAAPGWAALVLLVLTCAALAAAVWRFTLRNLPVWGPRRGMSHLVTFTAALSVGLVAGYLTTPAAVDGQSRLSAVAWWTPLTGSVPLGLTLSAVGAILTLFLAGLAWRQVAGPRRAPDPTLPSGPPAEPPAAVEPRIRTSAGRSVGRGVVVLLAVILVGSLAWVPWAMIRTQVAEHHVVDPFTALIVAAIGCYLVSLARAVTASTRAAAHAQRTQAMEFLAAAFLLLIAGMVVLGDDFHHVHLSKAAAAGVLVGVVIAVVGLVSWHAAGYAHDACRAIADRRDRTRSLRR